MPTVSKHQLQMDFEPAITEQFRTLKQCVSAVVYSYRGGLNAVAAACDVSPSTLSRMLNEQENEENRRQLPMDFLPLIMAETKDMRPLLWLGAKFLPNEQQRHQAAVARIEQLLPELTNMMATLKKAAR